MLKSTHKSNSHQRHKSLQKQRPLRQYKQNKTPIPTHSSTTQSKHHLCTSTQHTKPLSTHDKLTQITPTLHKLHLDRFQIDQLILRKMIFVQSYEIYGGSSGLYDFGPAGSAIMANIRSQWRKHFIKAERMLEFSGATLTPEGVLKASGHLERFTDWMTATKPPVVVEASSNEIISDTTTTDNKNSSKTDNKNQSQQSPSNDPKNKPFEVEHIRTDKLVEDFLDTLIDKLQAVKNKKTPQQQQQQLTAEETALLDGAIKDRTLVSGMNGHELDELVQKYHITHNGHQLHPSTPFNLMFSTQFGPSSKSTYYFRPETAQSIFVNFQRLFNQNNNTLPFSVAQIGTAYRNEISPRNGILRTREFTQAEIEHFVDPTQKQHENFEEIANFKATFLSSKQQLAMADGTFSPRENIDENGAIMSFRNAVHGAEKTVDNESLGYFLAKTLKFLTSIGVHQNKIRFRQHLPTEMAHYATDCWDAEILTTFGWVECVGHADRSAHDLTVHAAATQTDLHASVALDTPKIRTFLKFNGNKGDIVKYFKTHKLNGEDMGKVMTFISTASQEALEKVRKVMYDTAKEQGMENVDQHDFTTSPITISFPLYGVDDSFILTIPTNVIKLSTQSEKIHIKQFTPHVIEPSFGLARIFYSVLEHSFSQRADDEQRKVLQLPPAIAPYQVGVYTVASNLPGVKRVIRQLHHAAIDDYDLAIQIDDSRASIGRKYSRWDEYGVPFAISIDSSSLHSDPALAQVTIRERDSCDQIRLGLNEAMGVVSDLVKGRADWAMVLAKYEKVTRSGNHDGEHGDGKH